jgi:SepF-like predicted cell division protein (DUF552 family)
MFDWLKRLFKKEEKIDWSKAKLIQDTKKRVVPTDINPPEEPKKPLLEHIEPAKNNELKDAEKVSKESFKIYEGFLICDKDMLEDVENALRKIIEKDPSFPKIDRVGALIVLRGNNKDELHKKLSWVVNNIDGAKGYWVRTLE